MLLFVFFVCCFIITCKKNPKKNPSPVSSVKTCGAIFFEVNWSGNRCPAMHNCTSSFNDMPFKKKKKTHESVKTLEQFREHFLNLGFSIYSFLLRYFGFAQLKRKWKHSFLEYFAARL